jgi:hypothetical protein
MRRLFLVAAFVSVLVVAPVTVSLAQPPTFDRDPASGPPGTEIVVRSVDPCPPPPGADDAWATVVLAYPDDAAGPPPNLARPGQPPILPMHFSQPAVVVARDDADIDGAGAWEARLIVPEDAAPGTYFIAASCTGINSVVWLGGTYQEQAFEVTPVATTTTAPPTATATPPAATPPTATPPTTAPVRAQPTFTG